MTDQTARAGRGGVGYDQDYARTRTKTRSVGNGLGTDAPSGVGARGMRSKAATARI